MHTRRVIVIRPRQPRPAIVAKTVGVILVAVGVGVLVVTLGIPEAIVGAFLLIIRLAISAWEILATIIGVGTGEAALGAG